MYLLSFNCVLLLFSVVGNAQAQFGSSAMASASASASSGNQQQPSFRLLPLNQLLRGPPPNLKPQSNSECIPDKKSLNVTLDGGAVLNRCSISQKNDSQLLSKKDFKKPPKSVEYRYADEDTKYTLIVYATSAQLNSKYLEWIVSNIKGSDLKKGEVNGDDRVEYRRADPVPNECQIHEYEVFAETVDNQKVHIPRSRYNWDVMYFLKQQPHELKGPIGVTNGRTRKVK